MPKDRVLVDPAIMMGKPCIVGTRITVEAIIEDLADGMTVPQVLQAYEDLTEEDVRAALEHAAIHLREDGVGARE